MMISAILRIFLVSIFVKFSFQIRECGLYGTVPCTYVPAPPGMTPACASPGKTYCETVKNYPTHIIRRLINKWGYEANDIIVDETTDEFASNRFAHTNRFFHSPYFAHQNALQFNEGYNYPKPQRPFAQSEHANIGIGVVGGSTGNGYVTNSQPIFVHRPSYPKRRPASYINNNHHHRDYNPNENFINSKPMQYTHKVYVTKYKPTHWLKRFVRDVSPKEIFSHEDFKFMSNDNENEKSTANGTIAEKENEIEQENDLYQMRTAKKNRVRRQSPGRQSLCQTNFQFITPKAALNSQGNWRYVVNMVDVSRQLVRVETCASSICSNLCQLPNGYNSRCEQKFVQKRLIALNGDGQSLYTDTFWFPSCCACTISNQ